MVVAAEEKIEMGFYRDRDEGVHQLDPEVSGHEVERLVNPMPERGDGRYGVFVRVMSDGREDWDAVADRVERRAKELIGLERQRLKLAARK